MCRDFSATIVITVLMLLRAASPACRAADVTSEDQTTRTLDVVYVGTPYDVIDKMLETASIQRADVIYDLGCGDGRIIVAAAKRFGCRGVGYDIDPQRIREALENVRKDAVGELVEIKRQDIFTVDLSQASVIMLYLLPELNEQLIPQLKKLKPGSRIVTHEYAIEGIAEETSVTMKSLEDGVKHYLYLYKTPLKDDDEE